MTKTRKRGLGNTPETTEKAEANKPIEATEIDKPAKKSKKKEETQDLSTRDDLWAAKLVSGRMHILKGNQFERNKTVVVTTAVKEYLEKTCTNKATYIVNHGDGPEKESTFKQKFKFKKLTKADLKGKKLKIVDMSIARVEDESYDSVEF